MLNCVTLPVPVCLNFIRNNFKWETMKTSKGNFDHDTLPGVFPREIHERLLPNLPGSDRLKHYVEVNKLYIYDNDKTKDNSKYTFIVDWQM